MITLLHQYQTNYRIPHQPPPPIAGNGTAADPSLWESLGSLGAGFFPPSVAVGAAPPAGIECTPAPGPFLPCNDLFDWWTLR